MSALHGRVALVTGAGRGTGRCHCERLADQGADIIALDVSAADADLEQTAAVRQRGRRVATGLADVGDFTALAAAMDAGVAELGRLDIVIANAGIHTDSAPTWGITAESRQRTLDVNLTGAWHNAMPPCGTLATMADRS